jgi:hypothetical protein
MILQQSHRDLAEMHIQDICTKVLKVCKISVQFYILSLFLAGVSSAIMVTLRSELYYRHLSVICIISKKEKEMFKNILFTVRCATNVFYAAIFFALDMSGIEEMKKLAMMGDTVALACSTDALASNLSRWVAMTGDLVDLFYYTDVMAKNLSRWVAMTGDTVALPCFTDALASNLSWWVAMTGDTVVLTCSTDALASNLSRWVAIRGTQWLLPVLPMPWHKILAGGWP